MALVSLQSTLLILLLINAISFSSPVRAQIDRTGLNLMSEALEWPSSMSIQNESDAIDKELERETGMDRRSLYWTRHYYISYGALAANRIPCPARSGRSYYTHNCYKARGQANPYTRGCSAITRCRR